MVVLSRRFLTARLYTFPRCTISSEKNGSGKQPKNVNRPPPRITANVKRSLQWLKIMKEYERRATSTSPKPSTSYRKKKLDKSELADECMGYEDPTTKLYQTNVNVDIVSPVLLVDGYNLCGCWSKLKKHFARGDLETARDKLLHELICFSVMKGVKVVVVFDAVLSGLTTRKETTQTIDVIYAAHTCADSWIEREVSILIADGCPKVWVVTSDTFHQQAAYGAGAYVWNCKVLISEIKDARRELQESLHDESQYSVKGKLLEHNLDPEAISALQNLKRQLKASEG